MVIHHLGDIADVGRIYIFGSDRVNILPLEPGVGVPPLGSHPRRKLPGFVRFRTRPVTPENLNAQLQIARKISRFVDSLFEKKCFFPKKKSKIFFQKSFFFRTKHPIFQKKNFFCARSAPLTFFLLFLSLFF